MSSHRREIEKLARKARQVGFQIEVRGRHARWIAPDGEMQTVSISPRTDGPIAALMRWVERFRRIA